jgi:SAM-dependent methyltransferase
MSQANLITRLEEISENKLTHKSITEFLKSGRNIQVENLVKLVLEDNRKLDRIELISPLIQKIITQKIVEDYNNTDIALLSFLNDEIILNFLEKGLITNLFIEDFFQKVRSSITKKFATNIVINPKTYDQSIPIIKAIASQCFTNEYIWDISDEDKKNISLVEDKTKKTIINNGKIPNSLILILSSFKSLNKYIDLISHVEKNIGKYEGISHVLQRQILDFNEESKLRKTIIQLTNIKDTTSKKVKNQYEENPYPRWLSVPKNLKKMKYGEYINNSLFKKIPKKEIESISDILIAGCGTGRHPAMIAAVDRDIQITAIDISKSSLSYGKRMAKKLDLQNIRWAQADILELDNIKNQYDLIESVGVIHHMKDPKKGFESLDRRLKKNGLLKLGLYARYFRKARLGPIKNYIAVNKLPPTIESIRKVRKYIFNNLKNPDFSPLATIPDYYNSSGFRDLLMHVQEWDYTTHEIQKMIKDKYDFIGFTFFDHKIEDYKKKFPDDKFLNNLSNWDIFEKENPDFFSGMYQFWLQKK